MKNVICALMVLMFVFTSTITMADTKVTVDLKDLPANVRNQVLDASKAKDEAKAVISKENVQEFSSYGKVIAETLKEVCVTLNVEVNKFIQTPAGMIVTGLIVYKVIGHDLLRKVLGMGMWLVVTPCLYLIAHIFLMRKKVKLADGNIEYVEKYNFQSSDAKGALAFVLIGLWVAVTFFSGLAVLV